MQIAGTSVYNLYILVKWFVLFSMRACAIQYLFSSNYSTYNADFDGDEMNVHFPQDEISRAEAYNIVNANNQYVKPTSGEPIRALIQVPRYFCQNPELNSSYMMSLM